MDDRLTREVAAIANDHRSGASALLRRALAVLRQASATGPASLERISLLVCRAQPSMGAVWNAVCAALGADDPVRALETGSSASARRTWRSRRSHGWLPRCCPRVTGHRGWRPARPQARRPGCSLRSEHDGHCASHAPRGDLSMRVGRWRPGWPRPGWRSRCTPTGGWGAALGSSHPLLLGADAVSGDWVSHVRTIGATNF